MRRVKSEALKACGELMSEMAFMPDEIDDTVGVTDQIITAINTAKEAVQIVKKHYGTINTRKN